MDFENSDLHDLQTLFNSLETVLKDHEEQLKSETESGKISSVKKNALETKISHLKISLEKIENKIIDIDSKELRFSVEYIFWNFGLIKKSVQIHFITTSQSYKKYGQYVTGVPIYQDHEINELIRRVKENKTSDGQIKFEEIVNDQMSSELKKDLKENGFLASEIYEIKWV